MSMWAYTKSLYYCTICFTRFIKVTWHSLSMPLQLGLEWHCLSSAGSVFHRVGAATLKHLAPYCFVLYFGTVSRFC